MIQLGRSRTFWWLFGAYAVFVLSATAIPGLVATTLIDRFELRDAEQDLRVKALEGLIFIRSVHHRNRVDGAGYPRPRRLTQKVSDTSGTTLWASKGSPNSFAARFAASRLRSLQSTPTGISMSGSDEMHRDPDNTTETAKEAPFPRGFGKWFVVD